MKIEIPDNCIIINGECYEMTEDDKLECDGCVFNTPGKNGGCSADTHAQTSLETSEANS